MKSYSYAIAMCFGFIMMATGCGGSSGANGGAGTTAPTCANGQLLYTGSNSCVQACGNMTNQGIVNGACTSLVTTNTTTFGCVPCMMYNGQPGIMTVGGCGFQISTTNVCSGQLPNGQIMPGVQTGGFGYGYGYGGIGGYPGYGGFGGYGGGYGYGGYIPGPYYVPSYGAYFNLYHGQRH